MRIISGKYRGIKIPSPKEEIVKPTLDRIKENIFNIIQFDVENSEVLDLFCGSGALGIECLSRFANHATFVDNNKQNIDFLKEFLKKIKAENFSLVCADFYEALKNSAENGKKYDIIFLDPPYDSNLAEIAIQKIFKFGLLAENGKIVWEHSFEHDTSKFSHKIILSKTYGKIKIDFISL